MDRTKALAAVCLLLLLVGGSTSFALADSSDNETEIPKQTAAVTEQTESGAVQIMPTENRVLRDQSVNFAVRVVSDGEDGILLGLRIGSEIPASFEFYNPDVRELSIPLVYPDFDTVAYIPAEKVDTEEYVPVKVSPKKKFPRSGSTIEVGRISREETEMATDEMIFEIRCPIECQVELLLNWLIQNIELLVSILGLLIAFFGRKKIWSILQTSKARFTGSPGGEARRQNEDDMEMK
jgi:hypothetical protein